VSETITAPTADSNPSTPSSDEVLLSILDGISQETGVPTLALPPLSRSVDMEALSDLFGFDNPNRCGTVDGQATFTYAGFEVTVYGTGIVDIEAQ
jgi:hypothetical protein